MRLWQVYSTLLLLLNELLEVLLQLHYTEYHLILALITLMVMVIRLFGNQALLIDWVQLLSLTLLELIVIILQQKNTSPEVCLT
jgi:hypothetical protein